MMLLLYSDPTNRGNFISLLRFRAQSDDVLRRFIESAPKDSTYTSCRTI